MLINVLHVLPVFQTDDTRSVEQNLQETNCPNGRLSILNVRVVFISSFFRYVVYAFVDIRMDDREQPMLDSKYFSLPAHCSNANGPSRISRVVAKACYLQVLGMQNSQNCFAVRIMIIR
jgi:hypothetical protein